MSKPVKNINQTPTEAILKESILDLIYQKSISKITVKELCEKAGIYRSTFYAHYKSPEELLAKIQADALEDLTSYFINYNQQHNDNQKETAIAFLNYIKSHDYTLKALLFLGDNNTLYLSLAKTIAEQFVNLSRPYGSDALEEYTPLFMAHGLVICVMHWMNSNYATPVEEFSDFLIQALHNLNTVRK